MSNQFSYPGVYNQQVASAPGPIAGVSTSNLGLIGYAPEGPIDTPTLCTSFPEFVSKFGTFNSDSISAHEAYAFFANEGRIMYFVRVAASDAVDAYWDLSETIAAEQVTNTSQPTGVYNLQLDKFPVIPSSLVLTCENTSAAYVNVFTCNATGTLTFSAALSGASASGGSGTVDLDTGEVHLELTNPSDFAGSTYYIKATYGYTVFRFKMAWPGVAGNYYRVRVTQGDDDYLNRSTAAWSRFNVFVDKDINEGVGTASWNNIKSWTGLVFNDVTSPYFVATIINSDPTSMIEVVDYGNGVSPSSLQGTSVSAEDVTATQLPVGSTGTAPVDYDATTKAWNYTLANSPFPGTLSLNFKLADALVIDQGSPTTQDLTGAVLTDSGANFTNGGSANNLIGKIVVNITDASSAIITANTATTITATLAGGTTHAWHTTDDYVVLDPKVKIGIGTGATGSGTESIVSPGSASIPARIVPGTVCISVTMTGAGASKIIDDGNGNLKGNTGSPANVGTIDYTTGQITSEGSVINQLDFDAAWSGDTVVAGTPIYFGCIYYQPVSMTADANGVITKNSTQAVGYPSKFSLNTSATNSINYTTKVVTLTWKISGNPSVGPAGSYTQTVSYYTNPSTSVYSILANGADGSAITSADIIDAGLAGEQKGLYAFGKVDAMMNLVVADFQTDATVFSALLDYCALVGDKFAIGSVPYGYTYEEAINWKKYTLNKYSEWGALYYPHVKITDPVTKVNIDIPAGGHIAGVYARTDINKNVGKAPAGVGDGDLAWSVGLEQQLSDDQIGLVYEQKINALSDSDKTGRVVWGARTLDINGGEYPYIQGKRTMMFVQKSVYNSTHIHVFKNNGANLWSAIRTQVGSFLLGLHTSGYFAGTTPSESYYVVCDATINTQDVVDRGICYCDVGIATNKPAEFLVFRYALKANA